VLLITLTFAVITRILLSGSTASNTIGHHDPAGANGVIR
jgi:hypothetical protein